MKNIKGTIYEDFYKKLYNPDLKIKFLESNYPSNENTKRSILFMFRKSAASERVFGKDLCVLNQEEILDLARRLDYKTLGTMESAFSYFASYTDWCIANGLRGSYDSQINDIALFAATQDLSKFLPRIKVKNRYLIKSEVYDLVDNLVNHQDKAYILGIYEGIGGEEMHELRSLKLEDIDLNTNLAILTNLDGSRRIKKISDKLKNIFIYANSQEEYLQSNGQSLTVKRGRRLSESPYILKTMYREASEGMMMGYGTFSQKMVKIRTYIDYKFISIVSIADSGAINRVIELMNEQGLSEPTREIFDIVGSKSEYNLPRNSLYKLIDKYKIATKLKDFK
ncbi:hypothetical protein ACR77J_07725 [Tissierella praeacuta]|uniref:phage lytic cycle repressor MrpR family protein n=1 Tax=Tissierella praeacuta TaxID=43131 RepID=UPI003DA57E8A